MPVIEKMKDLFFVYDTPKILHFPSKSLGILNRVIQLTIIIYILVYVIGIQKGYQSKDQVVSAVSAKVKGVVKTDFSERELVGVPREFLSHYNRIWDVTDIVEAETGAHGFFVQTNLVITPDQTKKTCPEDPSVEGSKCSCPSQRTGKCLHDQTRAARSNKLRSRSSPTPKSTTFFSHLTNRYTAKPTRKTTTPRYKINGRNYPKTVTPVTRKSINLETSCKKGDANTPHSTGIKTGYCDAKTGTCEIEAWCPVEKDTLPMGANNALLDDTKKMTVLIKNQISFPNFNFATRNILDSTNEDYLNNCRYDNKTNRFCPVFELETIVKEAGVDYSQLAIKGGVIQVAIHWDCDLDRTSNKKNNWKHCQPEYKFRRLDAEELANKKIGGWNYRYADYIDTNRRILYKAYGINFIINVFGEARKFDIVPTMRNIGAGLGLMALSSFICNRIIDILRVAQKEFNEEFEFIEFDKAQRMEFEQSDRPQEDNVSL